MCTVKNYRSRDTAHTRDIRGNCAQTIQNTIKTFVCPLEFLRTYSIRICLQKLTESRIFTNAAFFIFTRWHSRSLVTLRTWPFFGTVSRTFGGAVWCSQERSEGLCQRVERLSDGYLTYLTLLLSIFCNELALKLSCPLWNFNRPKVVIMLTVFCDLFLFLLVTVNGPRIQHDLQDIAQQLWIGASSPAQ